MWNLLGKGESLYKWSRSHDQDGCHAYIWYNQRTNGPVNAHLISWPSKAQDIQNLENIWYRNDLDLLYSHNFRNSISCLHLPTFRSLAAIVSEKSTVFTFFP